MNSPLRRNLQFLRILVAAWSIMLGTAHSLHAAYHLTLTGTVSATTDHSCTLCSLDREPLLPTPTAEDAALAPEPVLLALLSLDPVDATSRVQLRNLFSPCAGRAPPFSTAS